MNNWVILLLLKRSFKCFEFLKELLSHKKPRRNNKETFVTCHFMTYNLENESVKFIPFRFDSFDECFVDFLTTSSIKLIWKFIEVVQLIWWSETLLKWFNWLCLNIYKILLNRTIWLKLQEIGWRGRGGGGYFRPWCF